MRAPDQPDSTGPAPVLQWSLVELNPGRMPRWCMSSCRDGQVQWMDGVGIAHPAAGTRALLRLGVRSDLELLTHPAAIAVEAPLTVERVLDPESDLGWVCPDGLFWGCAYAAHELLCHGLMRRTSAELSAAGWVRVDHSSFAPGTRPEGPVRLTPRQIATLGDLGFPDPGESCKGRLPRPERDNDERLFAVRREAAMNVLNRAWMPRPVPEALPAPAMF